LFPFVASFDNKKYDGNGSGAMSISMLGSFFSRKYSNKAVLEMNNKQEAKLFNFKFFQGNSVLCPLFEAEQRMAFPPTTHDVNR